jgi:hypothetical protein
MGAAARKGTAVLSEMQIPLLEPGTSEGEEVMPAPNDPSKRDEWRNKLRIAHLGMIMPPRSKEYSEKMRAALTGKPKSAEHRKKLSEAAKGRKAPNLGIPHSKETLEKISMALRGKSNPHSGFIPTAETRRKMSALYRGENNPNWRGGLSFEPYCPKFNKEFKERVRAFFGHKCVECGRPQTGTPLAVHHVNFNKKTCCDGTLPLFVPLCRSCHSKTNYRREYWQQHFTEMITSKYDGKCYFSREEMNL